MSSPTTNRTRNGSSEGTLRSYTTGFVLSLVLTLTAYLAVTNRVFSGRALAAAIVGLAITQLLVQLVFFLHLTVESKPKWNLLAFLFMLVVLIILVGGTLWIMGNLNYHTLSPTQTDTYLLNDEGVRQ